MPRPLDDSTRARERRAAVGMRIRVLRTWRGWSQERLAERAGIDRTQLTKIETGQVSPGLDYLWVIADALGVEIVEIFREDKPANWPPRERRSADR
jgi:transcriptional regulator with XRE-family HTH domain